MRDKLLKAVVLFVIGVVSGLAIWGVNLLTEDTIDENILNREKGFYKELFEIDESVGINFVETTIEEGFYEIEITLASDDSVVGYIYKGLENNNYGKVTVLVGVIDGEIQNVLISDSSNTPNFVKKIQKEYLGPFSGQSTDAVTYDTKTGASFTYGSVSSVVTEATEYYNTERSGE